MNLLAIDTSTLYESVSLSHGGQTIADVTLNVKTHSERLLPTIEDILNQTGMLLEELSGIAISIGPGSFTGLRIGLSTAKGLCFGLNMPLYVMSSLRSLANNVSGYASQICSLLDAGRGELYYAVYSSDLTEIHKPSLGKMKDVIDVTDDRTLFVCPTLSRLKEDITAYYEFPHFARSTDCYPKALSLIDIINNDKGCDVYAADDIAKIEPLYIRKSAAEENYKLNKKNK